MRKIILFLLYSPLALAQLTTVTGTVKDPTGLPYSNGTITPTLVISGSPRFPSGFPYTPPNQPVGLSSSGSFTMSLADVTQILPSGGTWSFHICSATGTVQPGSPITAGPVCFDTVGLIISGSAQDISTPLSAAAPRLTSGSGAGSGTVGPGTSGQFAVYNGATSVIGSTHLDDGVTAPSTITSSVNFQVNNGFGSVLLNPNSASITLNDLAFAPTMTVDGNGGVAFNPSLSAPLINLFGAGEVVGHGPSTPVPPAGSGAFGFLSGGIPAISSNGGAFTALVNPTSGVLPLNSSGHFIDSPLSSAGNAITSTSLQFLVPNCGGSTPQLALSSAAGFGICIDADGSIGFVQNSTTQAFRVSTSGIIESYNNPGAVGTTNTAGQGVSWIPCATSQKSETGADASVLSCAIVAAAGTYRIQVSLSVSAASAATLGWTATWTDSNGNAQSPANLSLFQEATAVPALTFTTSTAGNYYGFIDVDVNAAGTAIVVKTTFSGTSIAYKISATVERLI